MHPALACCVLFSVGLGAVATPGVPSWTSWGVVGQCEWQANEASKRSKKQAREGVKQAKTSAHDVGTFAATKTAEHLTHFPVIYALSGNLLQYFYPFSRALQKKKDGLWFVGVLW
jgi:hypothetical protein